MGKLGIKTISIIKMDKDKFTSKEDHVAIESPLEMRITYGADDNRSEQPLSITMRTPGHDDDLAIGFLFTEGIIKRQTDIIRNIQVGEDTISTEFHPDLKLDTARLQRHFYTSSSCGVCGKASVDLVKTKTDYSPKNSDLQINSQLLGGLQDTLKKHQKLFNQTGGIHAAALFNDQGEIILLREDVGRHNAVDKVIGAAIKKSLLPLYDHFIMVSGRASFELIQKASMAGLPILVAVGAPSSLAIELAEEQSLCLVGFLKKDTFNIYSSFNRILHEEG